MANTITINGAVDPHVHLRGLEWSHKGTFLSETKAAVAGGYWAICDMPNTPPTTITRSALDRKLTSLDLHSVCDFGVYFGASQTGNYDEYVVIMSDVCGLKMFCNATTGDLLLDDQKAREQHVSAWMNHKLLAVHAEGETILDILDIVRRDNQPTHFLHISTAQEIEMLKSAKAEGLPVTLGVCPHHLWFTQDDLPRLKGFGRMKPELKTKTDQAMLWEAVREGVVDVIESDHAPHSIAEKESNNPPYGVTGLETTIPLLCTAVHEGRLELEQMIALVSTNPQRIWGITSPPDTYTVIDLDASYTIENERLFTQCGWSPFAGMTVQGKVVENWIRGTQVYDGARILVDEGFGQNLYG